MKKFSCILVLAMAFVMLFASNVWADELELTDDDIKFIFENLKTRYYYLYDFSGASLGDGYAMALSASEDGLVKKLNNKGINVHYSEKKGLGFSKFTTDEDDEEVNGNVYYLQFFENQEIRDEEIAFKTIGSAQTHGQANTSLGGSMILDLDDYVDDDDIIRLKEEDFGSFLFGYVVYEPGEEHDLEEDEDVELSISLTANGSYNSNAKTIVKQRKIRH